MRIRGSPPGRLRHGLEPRCAPVRPISRVPYSLQPFATSRDALCVAATDGDLAADVEEGDFRRDLYYNLNASPVGRPLIRLVSMRPSMQGTAACVSTRRCTPERCVNFLNLRRTQADNSPIPPTRPPNRAGVHDPVFQTGAVPFLRTQSALTIRAQ